MDKGLTHFDEGGHGVMVDVGDKDYTQRVAVAKGKIRVNEAVFAAIKAGTVVKGDVLGVARVAGIMGSKRTADLIPMCHPLLITKCSVDFRLIPLELAVEAVATVKVTGQTGVEMEALMAVNVALLTIYDMCKALDKTMTITEVCLWRKSGGKSGEFLNPQCNQVDQA